MIIKRNITADFRDKRGSITKILDDGKTKIRSILMIDSKSGSIRSNHYHKKDSHWIYVFKGKMEYYEKSLKKGSKIKKVVLQPGDAIFTPPLFVHATKFLEKSLIFAFSTKSRNQKDYEEDTIPYKLI